MNEEANYSTTFLPESGKDYALTTTSMPYIARVAS